MRKITSKNLLLMLCGATFLFSAVRVYSNGINSKGNSSGINDIIIDQLSFEDAAVDNVFRYLHKKSIECDPRKRGVNIFFLSRSDDISAVSKISMELNKIPIMDAIYYTCEKAGLNYSVKNNTVIVNKDVKKCFQTKYYRINKNILKKITGGTSPQKLKKFFESGSIFFPQNSSIHYDNKTGKLIATNTYNNIWLLQNKLIDAMLSLKNRKNGFKKRLDKITIKKIDFEKTSIPTIIAYLRYILKKQDPARQGINLVLDLKNHQQNKVSLSLNNISLKHIIEYLCLSANLRFRIDPHAIYITTLPEEKSAEPEE